MAKSKINRYDRATRVYERTWDKVAPLFGLSADVTSPYYEFLSPGAITNSANPEALATMGPYGPEGRRGIKFSHNLVRNLGVKPRKKSYRLDKKRQGQLQAIHEWAHLFQTPEILLSPHVETGAEKFSAQTMRDLFNYKVGGGRLRQPKVAAMDQALGPESWKQIQFGENFGKDPSTLFYPKNNQRGVNEYSSSMPQKFKKTHFKKAIKNRIR